MAWARPPGWLLGLSVADDDFEPCRHPHIGFVTNQPDGFDPTRSHSSVAVCALPRCRAAAQAYVEGFTREPAVFRPFRRG